MKTTLMPKKKFIEWLKGQLSDDDIIVMSREMVGTIQVVKKSNQKHIPFAFIADTFRQADDINHIIKGETPMVAFAVCKKKDLSADSIKCLKEGIKRKTASNINQ